MNELEDELIEELKKIDGTVTSDDVRKAKRRIAARKYREKNRDKYNAYYREYHKKNKDKKKKARDLKNQRIADMFNESVK